MKEPDYVFAEYEILSGNPNPDSPGVHRIYGVNQDGRLYRQMEDALGNTFWTEERHGHNTGQALARELCRVSEREVALATQTIKEEL